MGVNNVRTNLGFSRLGLGFSRVRVSIRVSVIFRPYGRKSSVIIRYFPSVRTEI